jgi:hypothetical protein
VLSVCPSWLVWAEEESDDSETRREPVRSLEAEWNSREGGWRREVLWREEICFFSEWNFGASSVVTPSL